MTRVPARPVRRASRTLQRGLSLVGLLFLGVVLVFGAMLVMKVFPTATEFLAIKRAVVKARNEGSDPPSIRNTFERSSAIDDITSITARDLQIVRRPNGEYAVSFAYEKRIPLVGPASLVIDYRGEAVPGAGRGK
jgi:hypothetical protein